MSFSYTTSRIVLTLLWGIVFGVYFRGSIIAALGWMTLGMAVFLLLAHRTLLKQWLGGSWKEWAWGLFAGLVMTGLTYALFPVGVALVPGLKANVTQLYHKLFAGPGPKAMLHWMVLVITLEELVFRGLWMEPSTPHASDRKERPSLLLLMRSKASWQRVGLSVALYTLVHIGSGSFLLCSLTVVCGLVWSWMREWRGSLLMPLLCHLVWDLFVFIYFPLV